MLYFRVIARINGLEHYNKHWFKWDCELIAKHYHMLKDMYPDAYIYVELKEGE